MSSQLPQPCCGTVHSLPFLHRKWFFDGKVMRPYYTDKKGIRREVLECASCFRTLPERGLRPSNIRWSKPGSPHCEQCEREISAAIKEAAEQAASMSDDERQLVLAGIFGWRREG